ncbi:MAG: ATP synthase F1 subunit epsilon [Patescibacteria group bacterium]|jgi:F-type H+-transporting ATPase subunit epsilon|nr:ATP synthase F1 subunit epsilon [Patescibacteria group bacterium]
MSEEKMINFEIATPERVVFREQVRQVSVPTLDGEITVLPHHLPLVSILSPGVLELKKADNSLEVISVSGGFIEVLQDKVIILADTAERAEEIDLARAEESRKRAEESLSKLKDTDSLEFSRLASQIEKELARSRSVRKWRNLKGK